MSSIKDMIIDDEDVDSTVIDVFNSSDALDEDGNLHEKISSGFRYDKHLVHAFPHFAYVTYEQGIKLSDAIAKGIHKISVNGYPSFALTLDFNTDGKVLWLSGSALRLLKIIVDGYVFQDLDSKKILDDVGYTHRVDFE